MKPSKLIVDGQFMNAPTVSLSGMPDDMFNVKFLDRDNIDLETGELAVVGECDITGQSYASYPRRWWTNWRIEVRHIESDKLAYVHDFNPEGKYVSILINTPAIGDTIAWMPYVEEYRKKNKCNVICATHWNQIVEKEYPEISFIVPNKKITCNDVYIHYTTGAATKDVTVNKRDYRTIPLQASMADCLGIEYKEMKPPITIPDVPRNIKGKYVCISQHGSKLCKNWNNPDGWQQTVDYLKSLGYKVVVISKETDVPKRNNLLTGVVNKTGNIDINDRIVDLAYADMFIGVGSGLSWLAWAANCPTVLISGFSKDYCEMSPLEGVNERVCSPEGVCSGCFNDTDIYYQKNFYEWCPKNKNFECSTSITFERVKESIDRIIEHNKLYRSPENE